MNIYTKKGDSGTTSLLNGENVSKSDFRLSVIGDLDELSSHLGLVKNLVKQTDKKELLNKIQYNIYRVNSTLSNLLEDNYLIDNDIISILESTIDYITNYIPSITKFVFSGECRIGAQFDICRTIARRCERGLSHLSNTFYINADIYKFINRLSDYLFMEARYFDFIALIDKSVNEQLNITKKEIKNNQFQSLSLEIAKDLIEQIEKKSKDMNMNSVISVLNLQGNPIAIHVMDNAYLASYDVSRKKAYTAVSLKMSTESLNRIAQPNEMFFGIEATNEQIIIIGGGVTLELNNQIVGGLGISGGTDKQDIELANYGKKYFESKL